MLFHMSGVIFITKWYFHNGCVAVLPDSPNNLPSLQCPPDEQFEGARIFRTPSCINTESPTDVRVFCGVQNGTILTTTTTITCVCVYQDDVVDECSYTLTCKFISISQNRLQQIKQEYEGMSTDQGYNDGGILCV